MSQWYVNRTTGGRSKFIVSTPWFQVWVGLIFDLRDLWVGVFHRQVIVGSAGTRAAHEFYIGGPLVYLYLDVWLNE